MFSNYNILELEINNRGKCSKFTKGWELGHTLINNPWVRKKPHEKLETILQ